MSTEYVNFEDGGVFLEKKFNNEKQLKQESFYSYLDRKMKDADPLCVITYNPNDKTIIDIYLQYQGYVEDIGIFAIIQDRLKSFNSKKDANTQSLPIKYNGNV